MPERGDRASRNIYISSNGKIHGTWSHPRVDAHECASHYHTFVFSRSLSLSLSLSLSPELWYLRYRLFFLSSGDTRKKSFSIQQRITENSCWQHRTNSKCIKSDFNMWWLVSRVKITHYTAYKYGFTFIKRVVTVLFLREKRNDTHLLKSHFIHLDLQWTQCPVNLDFQRIRYNDCYFDSILQIISSLTSPDRLDILTRVCIARQDHRHCQ